MNDATPKRETPPYDRVVDCLADGARRETLSVLRDRTGPVPTRELATHVAAALSDAELVDVTREDRRAVHISLRHVHLPKLAHAGLVGWDAEADAVEHAGGAVLDHPVVVGLLDADGDDGDDWDAVLEAVGSERRRLALAVLDEADALDRRELARRVVARETGTAPAAVPEDATEAALVSLHHVHVPTLRHAGLVVDDDGTVRYAGHPDIEPEWLTAELPDAGPVGVSGTAGGVEPDDQRRASTGAVDGRERSIRTVDGREGIVARGQQLVDRADEELFLMITTDGLLEPTCVEKLRDALGRGVDVCVGSQTAAVRDHVREELPGATIWEPQTDWLNLPPNRERLGRLVLADRTAVLIGTLGEYDGEGEYRETAITGEGENNGLVVLLRELLGSRLDHLDAQCADFRSHLQI